MDVCEYAELVCGKKLPEWQKEHLRRIYDIAKDNDIHICMAHGRVYTYLSPRTIKELTEREQTPHCHN